MDNILKPVLIAVIIILAVLIIWKANRFTTADQPEKETKAPPESKKPSPERPSSTPLEFFIVYQGRRVSRQHAELFRKSGQVCLRDLGSLNGTIVNKVPRSEIAIVGGERIQLGTTVLQIERAMDDVSDDTQYIRR